MAGLRERKKVKRRERISEVAQRLFLERGFEDVTVAEIANAADVSEKTVFNYFPSKEDLVYWGMETFEEQLLVYIRKRPPGESVLYAFGRFLLEGRGLLADTDPEAIERLASISRMIRESPALLAREHQTYNRYTNALALLLAEVTAAPEEDIEPKVVAHALMGLHEALVDYARKRIIEGVRNPRLMREIRAQAKRSLKALDRGLGSYGVRRDT